MFAFHAIMLLYCQISHLVHLSHHSIQHFAFKRPKNNSFILHWIYDKTPARLYQASTNVVDGCHSNHKPISAQTVTQNHTNG